MNNETQMALIHEIAGILADGNIRWWLFGGWAMDAHVGRITRIHNDVEFWVHWSQATPVRNILGSHGFEALDTQPNEESIEFERSSVRFSSAFFTIGPDGYASPAGRWSDWRFPPGSFAEDTAPLGGRLVPVMGVAGLLSMKEQFPTLRNGRPLREKDASDILVLRELVQATRA
jgi:lincosamide nucleotidyltransferase A/C/D/E